MTVFGYSPAQIRKAIVAAAGILTTLLTANLLPGSWAPSVSSIVGVLTAAATYLVPNTPEVPPGRHEAR